MHTLQTIFSTFATNDLEGAISSFSTSIVVAAAISLVVLIGLAILCNKRFPKIKPFLFIPIVVITISTTLAISGATVYLNVKSDTGGPVHWHADFQMWACDNELELRDPRGALNNKIGSPTLHEHNDQRIHLEGVPVELPEDASVGKFMDVIGGEISSESLVVPLNDQEYFVGDHNQKAQEIAPYITNGNDGKYARFINGQSCGAEVGEVQMFAFTYNEAQKTYTQTKVENPAMYQISPYSEVPAGDCLIIEFAPNKDRTDRLCQQYGIRDVNRCQDFGVKPDERDICTIKEVPSEGAAQ